MPEDRDSVFRTILILIFVSIAFALADRSILPGYYTKLFVLEIGVAALCGRLLLKPPTVARTSPLFLPVALFLAFSCLTTFWAVNRVDATVQLTHRITLGLFFLACLQRVGRSDLPILGSVVSAVAGITSVVGLLQYSGVAFLHLLSGGMPSATFGYRNYAAMVLIQAAPFAFYALVQARSRSARVLWAVNLALILTYLLATRTRAAWGAVLVALACGGVLVLVIRKRSPDLLNRLRRCMVPVACSAIAALMFSYVVPPRMGQLGYEYRNPEKTGVIQTVATLMNRGQDKGRITMWANTSALIFDHPHGVGPGNWQYIYPAYDRGEVTSKGRTPRRPHNDYLWMAAELGLLGGAAYVYLLCAASWLGLRTVCSGRSETAWMSIASLCSLVAISAHAFFSYPSERIDATALLWLNFVILSVNTTSTQRSWASVQAPVRIGVLASLAAACIAYRAIQFERDNALATAYADAGNWAAVEIATANALAHGPFDPQVFLLRGAALHARGHYAEAVTAQKRCLSYHPNFVNALNNLGMSLNALGLTDLAIDRLNQARALQPDHLESLINLGNAYRSRKEWDAAIDAYQRAGALHVGKPPDLRIEIARTYEMAERYDEAGKVLDELLADRPDDIQVHYRRAVVSHRTGRSHEAKTFLDRLMAVTLAYTPAYYTLGEVLTDLGDTTGAVEAYTAFLYRWDSGGKPVEVVKQRLEALK